MCGLYSQTQQKGQSHLERQKLILLKSARRRGKWLFLKQLFLSVRDTIWANRHLIYRVGPDDVPDPPMGDGSLLQYRQILRWHDWPEEFRSRLLRESDELGWGQVEWFENGWWIWAGEIDGQVATFCWVYPTGSNDSFFDQMVQGSEFIWQVTTLPEFRGRKLYERMMIELMTRRFSEGVTAIYGCCRDYNLTSRLVLPKVGYGIVGHLVTNKWTGKRRWAPNGTQL